MTALKEKLSDDEITPKNMALVGRSAGAHLALLYGYTRNNPLALSYGINVENLIDISHIVADVGITDATKPMDFFSEGMNWGYMIEESYELLSSLIGMEVTEDDFADDFSHIPVGVMERLEAASPTFYVTPDTPPTLLRYAGKDYTVPAYQGDRLKTALEASNKWEGIDFNLFHFPNSGHELDFKSTPVEDSALYQTYWAKYNWYFDTYMD